MNPRDIKIEDFTYPLPDERIAKHPLAVRSSCKLLVSDGCCISDHVFSELPELLPADAMLVYNNTRVINARLRFNKTTGALIEIFCLEPHSPSDYEQAFGARGECAWQCLVGNSKKWKDGPLEADVSTASGATHLVARRLPGEPAADRSQTIAFSWDNAAVSFSDIIAAIGEIPIPPYLNRRSEASDSTDYQTVYSHIDGSVAAPTAGLHFTPALLEAIDARGIDRREVTLHVGAGTFRPVKSEHIGEHDMHSEFIAVSRDFIAELAETVGRRPIVAVGTTSVRTLESLYHIGTLLRAGQWTGELPQWTPYRSDAPELSASDALTAIVEMLDASGESTLLARTRIIIAPGYTYRIVDAMITNFHQPQSTLLLLVSAFIGDGWRKIYDHALGHDYRFLSYGDACLFFNTPLCQ
ncbi:MAG: S-adenosylmethionine:tRNA ribosyltransferase-isomerase [Muribaculaceae bacterium]|nr:S-adenosylmethionine:tRNA ribosyltransferase-isomerase [Muribaculaceae bacterium]